MRNYRRCDTVEEDLITIVNDLDEVVDRPFLAEPGSPSEAHRNA